MKEDKQRVENLLRSRSRWVIGIDEVGMGALAGPIAVGAVVTEVGWSHGLVKDSKKYVDSKTFKAHEKRVKVLDGIIKPQVLFSSLSLVESQLIDSLGIQDAWHQCLWQVAKKCLERYPDAVVVVDGNTCGSVPTTNAVAIPRGDCLVPAVSAASVMAKVSRDRVMEMLGRAYPEYAFEQNKGYGTRRHMVALAVHGPCPVHRRSYDPVRRAEVAWQNKQQHKSATLG
jgi:ribonuclease HII